MIRLVWFWLGFVVFSVTLDNATAISWRPVLLVEEFEVPGENHRPAASHNVIRYISYIYIYILFVNNKQKLVADMYVYIHGPDNQPIDISIN